MSSTSSAADSHPQLWVHRPDPRTIVLGVSGDIDAVSTPRLGQLLTPRLETAVDTIVVDMSRVRFLGADGLHLLVRAHLRAHTRGVALRLVSGPAAVRRGLWAACRAAGLAGLSSYPSLEAALAEPSDDC